MKLRYRILFSILILQIEAAIENLCPNDEKPIKCDYDQYFYIKNARYGIINHPGCTSDCCSKSIDKECYIEITEKIYDNCFLNSCFVSAIDGPLFDTQLLENKCNSSKYSVLVDYECLDSRSYIKLHEIRFDKLGGFIIADDHLFKPSTYKSQYSAICRSYPYSSTTDFPLNSNLLLKIRSFVDFNKFQDNCLVGTSCGNNYLSINTTTRDSPSPKNILNICSPIELASQSSYQDDENFITIDLVKNISQLSLLYNFDFNHEKDGYWSKGPFLKYAVINCPLFNQTDNLIIDYDFIHREDYESIVYAEIKCEKGYLLQPYQQIDHLTMPDDARVSMTSLNSTCNHNTRVWEMVSNSYIPKCYTPLEMLSYINSLRPTSTSSPMHSTPDAEDVTLEESGMTIVTNGPLDPLVTSQNGTASNRVGTYVGDINKSHLLISLAIASVFILSFIVLIVCLCIFRKKISARIHRKMVLDASAGRLNQTRNFLLRSFGTYKFDNQDSMMYKSDYSAGGHYLDLDKTKLLMTPGNSTPYLMCGHSGTIPIRGIINNSNTMNDSMPHYLPSLGSSTMKATKPDVISHVTWKGSYQQVPYPGATPTISTRYNVIMPQGPKGTVSMAELSKRKNQMNPHESPMSHLYSLRQGHPPITMANNTGVVFNRVGNTHIHDEFGSEGQLALVGKHGFHGSSTSFALPNPPKRQENYGLNSLRTLSSQLTEETLLNYESQKNSLDIATNENTEELPLKQSEQAKLNFSCHRISSMIRSKWANAGINQNSESSRSSIAFESVKNQVVANNAASAPDEDQSLSERDNINSFLQFVNNNNNDEEGGENPSQTYLTPKEFNLNKGTNRPLSDAMLSNHYYLSGLHENNSEANERTLNYNENDYNNSDEENRHDSKTPENEDVYESVEDSKMPPGVITKDQ